MVKTCFKCGIEQDIGNFYKHKEMADGHFGKCKACTKKDVSENYQDKREAYAEYEKRRWKRPERKKAAIRYQRKRRKNNPETYKARSALGNAVRDGRIEKQNCQQCGDTESQAHHPDYSKPLDVIWLCRKCHLAEHGKKAYNILTKPNQQSPLNIGGGRKED